MPCTGRSVPFWLALGAATLSAVLLAMGRGFRFDLSDQVWLETVRPLLIATVCVALAAAASLAYGGGIEDNSAARQTTTSPAPRLQRPALWTVVALLLLVFLLRGL